MRDKEEFAVVFRGRRRRIPRSRTFGALNHFVRGVLPSYSHAGREHAPRCTGACRNCDPSESGEKLGAYAQNKLAERGVEIHVNTNVRTVSMYGVRYVGRDDVNRVFQVTCVVRLTLRKLLARGINVGGTGN